MVNLPVKRPLAIDEFAYRTFIYELSPKQVPWNLCLKKNTQRGPAASLAQRVQGLMAREPRLQGHLGHVPECEGPDFLTVCAARCVQGIRFGPRNVSRGLCLVPGSVLKERETSPLLPPSLPSRM